MSSVSRLGKFDITGQLGQGSFGVVYRGRDPDLGRDVAIKVCTLDDENLRQRFLREAKISGQLDHPNIVTVHDYSGEGEMPYLVQEFLSGLDLREVIKRRQSWSVERRVDVLIQVAEGLAYAHERGVIHRDIKPANVRVLDDGRVKILDFGIAKLAGDESHLTQKGVTMGTASYLPPEQVRGGDIDTRSDLFSFGVLAYELLTFERPFRGKTISALVYQILYKVPTALTSVWPECPPPLAAAVSRCLEKDADQRYADAIELAADLRAVKDGLQGGRWPAVDPARTPPPAPAVRSDEVVDTASDIFSQTSIARTAEEVTSRVRTHPEGRRRTPPPMPERSRRQKEGGRKKNEATQPVPILGPDAEQPPRPSRPSSRVAGDAATVRLPPDALEAAKAKRSAASPGEVAEPEEQEDQLATSGLEIGKLVAQGELEAALEQLEETIARQRHEEEDETQAHIPVPPPMPPRQSPAKPTATSRETPTPASTPTPTPATPPTPTPATTPPAAPVPGERELAPVPSSPVKTEDRGRRRQLPVPLVVGGVALVVVAAAVLAFVLNRTPSPAAPAPTEAAIPAPPPAASAADELGSLLLVTSPWAEISEITDAAGYLHELPTDPTTPLHVRLPEGLYRITLTLAGEDSEERICEVRVGVGEVATCLETLEEPSTRELFKEMGWWR